MRDFKLLTWNIRNGGGRDSSAVLGAAVSRNADVIVLTEHRSKNDKVFRDRLAAGGYPHVITRGTAAGKENSVLVASRAPMEVLDADFPCDPERGVCLFLPAIDVRLIAVHIPGEDDHKFDEDGFGIRGRERKLVFWDRLLDHARRLVSERVLLAGDFNTGLPEDTEGTRFALGFKMKALLEMGYVDAWRSSNGADRGYTYYSKLKTDGIARDRRGFRLDFVFASPQLAGALTAARHCHDVRPRLSDHAIVEAELRL